MGFRMLRFTPELASRAEELVNNPFKPKEITDLKKQIEGAKRVAALHFSVNGLVDEAEIKAIVDMKLRLDGLYGDWMEGKIG